MAKPGRKPGPNGPGVSHKTRPTLAARYPVLITYKILPNLLAGLRRAEVLREVRDAFHEGREAFGSRLCHFSLVDDRLHFVVESKSSEALSKALHALAVRVARAINRMVGRKGRVFADRYEMRILKTPADVRAALRLVEQGSFTSLSSLETTVVPPSTGLLQKVERALKLRRAAPARGARR